MGDTPHSNIKKLLLIINDIGGESVSQSLLKDKAFSTLLDQNPQFELRPEIDFASDKSMSRP
jgi:hypothetical protein